MWGKGLRSVEVRRERLVIRMRCATLGQAIWCPHQNHGLMLIAFLDIRPGSQVKTGHISWPAIYECGILTSFDVKTRYTGSAQHLISLSMIWMQGRFKGTPKSDGNGKCFLFCCPVDYPKYGLLGLAFFRVPQPQ